jgi:hydrogenase expression/formation protein HypE
MSPPDFALSCPLPIERYPQVLLAHGGGGKLMHGLIRDVFLKTFGGQALGSPHDATVLEVGSQRIAFTTDSFVVRPIFFPGGDLGSLAVHGTVNDLAMAGARPLWLSAAFIIEEGLPMEMLGRIVASMEQAARSAKVTIVTGDTKVVEKGKGDSLFITTAGIGILETDQHIHPQNVCAGDAILVSGDVGRHGMAVMSVREGLEFESDIESDSAPLAEVVLALLSAGVEVHCLRDITRGGLTAVLNEIAEAVHLGISVDEARIPVRDDVRAACEILGLDPLQVACEGRFVAFIPEKDVPRALGIMASFPLASATCRIGQVLAAQDPLVTIRSSIGACRILDMPTGEQLPRIC